jgi:hypothetical protein
MLDSLLKNWKDALTEVLASLLGTLGIVLLIAFVLSGQSNEAETSSAFSRYFSGGQIGLSVLAVSGLMFLALRKHGSMSSITSIAIYILFLGPVFATAFIVGLNPGFEKSVLSEINLSRLWFFYFWLHILWFFILLLEPIILSGEEAGAAEKKRVSGIAVKAAQLGK